MKVFTDSCFVVVVVLPHCDILINLVMVSQPITPATGASV